MGNAILNHRVNNIKCRIQAHEYFGETKKAEAFRELIRMIEGGFISTLAELNKAMKKRNVSF